jgi:hypothetical protein
VSKRPLDDRPPYPEIHEFLVLRLPRPPELQRQVLRIRPSIQERVKDIRSPIRQQAPTAREERVWLKVVGNSPALDVEGTVGWAVRLDTITFEDNHVLACPGEGERGGQSRDAASSDYEPHTPKLSGRPTVGKPPW